MSAQIEFFSSSPSLASFVAFLALTSLFFVFSFPFSFPFSSPSFVNFNSVFSTNGRLKRLKAT